MEARFIRGAFLAAAWMSVGASYRTTNFDVEAPAPEMARKIGETAERCRHDLAIDWLGRPLPRWSRRCPIQARVAPHLGAGGATSFLFEGGEVYGWRMTIQGSLERILDSVVPHEVTHTIFACHFRQALPRWADEGACTSVEHTSERAKQNKMLVQHLQTRRGIPFSSMFAMKEYPADVLPLYAQGHSVACYLIAHGGKRKYLDFLGDGMRDENWPRAVNKHYKHASLLSLQNSWLAWVERGSPPIGPEAPAGETLLASATGRKRPDADLIYRAQSADSSVTESPPLVPVPAARSSAGSPGEPPRGEQQAVALASPTNGATAGDLIERRPAHGLTRQILLEWSCPRPAQERQLCR